MCDSTMAAIWKSVDGTDLEVSNEGNVRRNGIELSTRINCGGYRVVSRDKWMYYIHRLVATAFIPNPENKRCVDHINGDKLDNRLENLRWSTYVENGRNSKKRSGRPLPRGVIMCRLRYVAQTRYDGKNHYLGSYDTPEEASEIYEVTAKELYGEFYRPL